MDSETGEYVWDEETGERGMLPITHNIETGEYEDVQRRRFKIPSSYYTTALAKDTTNESRLRKADPLLSQFITATIYLVPTIIFFHPIIYVFLILIEIRLHNCFHKKNKTLKNKSFYYRSPLHGILKEWCGTCKEENAKDKIAKLQDINYFKFQQYVKRVVT